MSKESPDKKDGDLGKFHEDDELLDKKGRREDTSGILGEWAAAVDSEPFTEPDPNDNVTPIDKKRKK